MPQPEDLAETARIEGQKQPDDSVPVPHLRKPWLEPSENERLGFFRVPVRDGAEYRCPACNGASPIYGHPQNRGEGHLAGCWLADAVHEALAERCPNQHDTIGGVEPIAEFAVIMLGTDSVDALSYCCAPCLSGLVGAWINKTDGYEEPDVEGWEIRRLPSAVR